MTTRDAVLFGCVLLGAGAMLVIRAVLKRYGWWPL